MAKAKKLVSGIVPQSKGECNEAIKSLGDVRRELLRVETTMNDAISNIKEHYEQEALPLHEKAAELLDGIVMWCEANRNNLTEGGRVKTAVFGNGEVKWRVRPPSVTVRGKDAVLERLHSLGLGRFVRMKEEVNKEAILEEPEAVKVVRGITVGSVGEDVVVEPYELELEKV